MRQGLRLLPLLLALGGCSAVPQLLGGGAAIISGAGTANPAVGVAVGIGTAAVADYALKYYGRTRQNATQDAIAAVAGPLPLGGHGDWTIRHTIPLGNEHGEVHVVRNINNPLAPCREIVFSVVDGETREWFGAHICRRGQQWRWASAEPAVERWGVLQ